MCILAHSLPLLSLPAPLLQDSDSDRETAMEFDGSHSHPRQVSASGLTCCYLLVLLCACRHWIAVFGHVVDRSLKRTVDGLSAYATARHSK
jgi:hypothetical protein